MSRPNSSWRVAAGGVLVEQTKPLQEVVISLGATQAARAERERAERAAPAPAALGKYADFASQNAESRTCDVHAVLPPPPTVQAWHLRSVGREILTAQRVEVKQRAPRMRWCGSRIRRGLDGVGLYARPDRAYGRVHGVCVCGQSLACPVCAPRVAAFRSAEVSECFKRAAAAGYEARLETFTMPHAAGTALGVEVDCFAEAWREMGSGRKALDANVGAFGHHTGREVTWRQENGWHYHHHRCRYDEPGKYDPERARYYWLAALEGVGRRTRGAEVHAFNCGVIGDEAHAEYVGKLALAVEADARAIGREVASSATKGRNLATLLLAASRGDEHAAHVWASGVQDIVTRKVSSVRWSRGLRAKVGMAAEKTDEQIAQDEVTDSDVFLGSLTPLQWRGVLMHKAEFALVCAANRGEHAVNDFLSGLGLGKLNDESLPAVVVPIQADNVYRGFQRAAVPTLPAPISKKEIQQC